MLYVSTTVFIAPVLFHYSDCLNLEAGAVAVFLAWFNCLLFLQRYTALNQTEYLVIFAIILVLIKTTALIYIKKTHQQKFCLIIVAIKKFKMAKNYLRRLKNIIDREFPHFCKIRNTQEKLDIQIFIIKAIRDRIYFFVSRRSAMFNDQMVDSGFL